MKKKEEASSSHFILNGRIVQTIAKNSLLITDTDRKWFFNHSHHFRFYSGCSFDECSICLEKYTESGDTITYFFCKHAFHTKCIENWLKTSSLCPLCKQDIKKHKEYEKMPGYPGYSNNQGRVSTEWQPVTRVYPFNLAFGQNPYPLSE